MKRQTLKMESWKMLLSFWVLAYFSGANLLFPRDPVSPSENGFMEPKCLPFRRWLYTPCSSSDKVIGSLGLSFREGSHLSLRMGWLLQPASLNLLLRFGLRGGEILGGSSQLVSGYISMAWWSFSCPKDRVVVCPFQMGYINLSVRIHTLP